VGPAGGATGAKAGDWLPYRDGGIPAATLFIDRC